MLLTADPDATSPSPDTETLAEFTHRQPASVRFRRDQRNRHRGHPVHQRHDGPAQGRRTDAQQHGAQRAAREPAVRPAPARRAPARAAAVPLLRPDRADERGVRRRRDDRAAAPVRRRDGAGTHAGRAGDLLRGRPDHVPRAAELRGDRPVRHREDRGPDADSRLRRRRAARGGDAAVRGAVRRAHPGGLRPVRDQPRRHLQPGRTGPAAPARSACPSGASRSDRQGRRVGGRRR